jgi:hypothetical protein
MFQLAKFPLVLTSATQIPEQASAFAFTLTIYSYQIKVAR